MLINTRSKEFKVAILNNVFAAFVAPLIFSLICFIAINSLGLVKNMDIGGWQFAIISQIVGAPITIASVYVYSRRVLRKNPTINSGEVARWSLIIYLVVDVVMYLVSAVSQPEGFRWYIMVWELPLYAVIIYFASAKFFSMPVIPKVISNVQKKPIRGWLLFPFIGITLAPILYALLFVLCVKEFVFGTTFEYIQHTSVYYDPGVFFLMLFETIVFGIFFLFSAYTAIMMYRRKKEFIMCAVLLFSLQLAFTVFHLWFMRSVMPMTPDEVRNSAKEVSPVLVGTCIWVPYMLVSKRVHKTFVR